MPTSYASQSFATEEEAKRHCKDAKWRVYFFAAADGERRYLAARNPQFAALAILEEEGRRPQVTGGYHSRKRVEKFVEGFAQMTDAEQRAFIRDLSQEDRQQLLNQLMPNNEKKKSRHPT